MTESVPTPAILILMRLTSGGGHQVLRSMGINHAFFWNSREIAEDDVMSRAFMQLTGEFPAPQQWAGHLAFLQRHGYTKKRWHNSHAHELSDKGVAVGEIWNKVCPNVFK